MFRRFILTLTLGAFALGGAAVAAAPAQADVAPFVVAQADPTYIAPGHIRGFVRGFNHFNMTLGIHGRDVPVLLHQGTIIRPTGMTPSPRMLVRVDGFFSGGVFNADRIVLVR